MCRRPRLIAAAAATLLVVGLASPAMADPITDKQRQAQQIADKIEALGEEAARLGEKYDGALVALQQAKDEVSQAQAKLDDLQARLGQVRSSVGEFAVRSYIYADQTDGLVAVMSGSSLTDGAAQREGYATVALGASSDVTDDMKALLEDTQAQQKVLTAKRDAQEKAAKDVANRQKAAEAAQAQQSDTLKKVKADLAVLVQQEQQRRAEAERRQAAAEAARAQAALAAARAPAPVIANVTPVASPTGAAAPAAAGAP